MTICDGGHDSIRAGNKSFMACFFTYGVARPNFMKAAPVMRGPAG